MKKTEKQGLSETELYRTVLTDLNLQRWWWFWWRWWSVSARCKYEQL